MMISCQKWNRWPRARRNWALAGLGAALEVVSLVTGTAAFVADCSAGEAALSVPLTVWGWQLQESLATVDRLSLHQK